MKIISFAETTPALLAGRKTVTRRQWSERHARSFKADEHVQAWDKSPRVKGAKRIGTIMIERAPYLQSSADIPQRDWEGEGFEYMTEHGLTLFGGETPTAVWAYWKLKPVDLWVVRFALVEVIA